MDSYLPEGARNARPETISATIAYVDVFGAVHLAAERAERPHDADPRRPVSSRSLWQRLWGTTMAAAMIAGGLAAAPAEAQTTLLNVSYDPTRELYREFNAAFNAHWTAEGHEAIDLKTSHGGSGAQARAVIDGLDAQVVTLALGSDIDAIAAKTDKIPKDWQGKLPHNSAPYTSTIVFLVREGNPKGLKDWDDLLRDDVAVITPNPKTSGGARWNYLAAWAYADKKFGGDDAKVREFMGQLFANVPVLDTGARGSTTTFAQRGIGDVLLAWENEAFLALDELGEDKFDIVLPSVSILAEPTVALVEGNLHNEAQTEAAKAYLEYLYSPEGQAIALKHFFRAWDTSAAAPEDVARFPKVDLVTIADFGGWAKVQPEHFGDGGVFDQIYVGQ